MYTYYLQQAPVLLAIFFSACVICPEQAHFNNFQHSPLFVIFAVFKL